MTEIIPGYFVHTPDEKFGPYANIMEADTAAEKLMSEGVQVLGITKEGFEGVVSYEALEYSAESFTSAAVTTRSLGSAEKYECPTCNTHGNLLAQNTFGMLERRPKPKNPLMLIVTVAFLWTLTATRPVRSASSANVIRLSVIP